MYIYICTQYLYIHEYNTLIIIQNYVLASAIPVGAT